LAAGSASAATAAFLRAHSDGAVHEPTKGDAGTDVEGEGEDGVEIYQTEIAWVRQGARARGELGNVAGGHQESLAEEEGQCTNGTSYLQ
jgi:hypothetical protein